MKHRRGIDLMGEDLFETTGRISGFTPDQLFDASRAFKLMRFAHIPASWELGIQCYACGHITMIDRYALERQVGSTALLSETRRRLRCQKCGIRGAACYKFQRVAR